MTIKLKKIIRITMLIIFVMSLNTIYVQGAEGDIHVTLNGAELTFDVPPQIIGGRTMVPMRAIFEALDAEVNWNENTRTITATQGTTTIIMQIDNAAMVVNGATVTLDVPPMLSGGRTLVPVRAVAEGLNADVRWDAGARIVIITTQERTEEYIISPLELEVFDIITHIDFAAHAVRYFFEQQHLPELLFDEQEKFIGFISDGNVREIERLIRAEWERVSIGAVASYIMTPDAEYSQSDMPRLMEDIARKRADLDLGEEHIGSVASQRINNTTNAIVIEMYYTNLWRLSPFIAIVYNEEDGLKYFTLERTVDGAGPFSTAYIVCLRTPERRTPYFQIENNRAAFIYAIRDLMSDSLDSEFDLRATVTIMGIRSAEIRDREGYISASISLYNNRGENVTHQFDFGQIKLISNAQIIDGDILNFNIRPENERIHFWTGRNFQYHIFHFRASWNLGDRVDITVEAGHYGRDFIEFRVLDVEIFDMTDVFENRSSGGVIRAW